MTDQSKPSATPLLAIAALAVMALFAWPPIAQDPAYHLLADQRALFGIPHFADTFSNLAFVIVGVLGLRELAAECPAGGLPELMPAYRVFFAGMVLIGLGSIDYHLAPSNAALLWDRLPMTISFMAFFAAIVGEQLSPALARWLLWPLVALGIATVLYWHVTETSGHGDLRPYGLVQFLPMLLLPLLLIRYPSPFSSTAYVWGVLAAYGLAKAAEAADAPLFAITGIISGHTLKHLLAAAGGYAFLMALRGRRANAEDSGS
jgi:hypothetical protein